MGPKVSSYYSSFNVLDHKKQRKRNYVQDIAAVDFFLSFFSQASSYDFFLFIALAGLWKEERIRKK